MTRLTVAFAFLALNFYTYHFLATEEVIPPRTSFQSFPMELGEWRCRQREQMGPRTLKNLGVTDYLICSYRRRPGNLVAVYIGYHATQVRKEGGGAGETSIHPPRHCLPGSGWDVIGAEKVSLDIPGLPERPADVNRLIIAKGEARQLVYYWYQSRGRVIADDWKKIANLFWDRATRHRTDGSLVRFTIPLRRGDEARAEADFLDLASRMIPQLGAYVPE